MRKRVFVLFVTLLFVLNAILLIGPENNVEAETTPPIPEIDYDYIYNVSEWLSQVIFNSYLPGELAKGRAFGHRLASLCFYFP